MKLSSWYKWLLVLSLAIAISGCQTARRTLNLDTAATLRLVATNSVNPDADDRSSPVLVRLFLLSDNRQFSREDFLSLYEDAQGRLGKDLIDTIVLKELIPGETREETIALTPEIKYVGVMAEFVRYQDADAITVLPIVDHKNNKFEVILNNTTVRQGEY